MKKISFNKNFNYFFTKVFAITIIVFFASCSSRKDYAFKSTDEAIKECQSTLNELRSIEKVNIKKLSSIVEDWSRLQDSTYSCLINDTTDSISDKVSDSYFTIADSIKIEIERLATSEKRTLSDVLYLKIHSSSNREEIQKSRVYKRAIEFYNSLDGNKIYPNVTSTVVKYNNLLSKPFLNEEEMLDFIKKEDVCFRSLMHFLPQIEQEELQYVTNKTANIFETVLRNIAAKGSDEQNDRLRTYLTIRFNRRTIYNAITCWALVLQNKPMTEAQKMNYRWMLIQPFMSIDNEAMAFVTKEQEKKLNQLIIDLPTLLLKLDGTKLDANEEQKLSDILTEYLLKAYLNTIL